MTDAFREILRPAGPFAWPLLATAAGAFGLAAWTAFVLAGRGGRVEARAALRALGPLGALCSAAPLLGLLGTVHGLSRTFRALDGERSLLGADLADGVSQALFTSQMGLCIAIPGLLAHAALRRAARRRFSEGPLR